MNRSVFVILVCVCWASLPFSVGSGWNYEDPESWEGICKTGKEQSPIDITGATQDKALDQFALTNYDMKMNNNFTATNNGHSIQISLPYAKFYNVSKGGLTGTYTTVQFHLHWGKDNSKGSEHTVDGRKYAAELHFVSYNTKYSNLDASLSHADGAAVLGVLIEVGDADNEAFSFLEIASNLTNAETYEKIKPFKLDPILPKDKTKYFRYQGSLTTPGCNEAVTWTVFKNSVKISERQMGLLRSLKDEHGKAMADNYRPVQELYERTITASFMVPTCSTSEIKITAVLVLSMLLAFLFLR
ncbi:carbonic anhydrase 2-like [Montipora capricornis]|uniref:carbonic anhydrase 2-like n=1 Tax=Montipora capricornis TaxID=246305 RepID=UPI0035F1B17E